MKTFLSKNIGVKTGLRSVLVLPCLVGSFFAVSLTTTAIASAQLIKPSVPAKLQVKDSEALLIVAPATGVQIYTCKANDSKKYEWKFKAPQADLFNVSGRGRVKVIRHFAGPSWEYLADKSKIRAKVVERVASDDPNAIPWLLLEVTTREGNGVLSNVTSIQRLNTSGGKAPTTVCDATKAGKEVAVPYEADYYFYGSTTVQGLW
jgi:hypothetical protein